MVARRRLRSPASSPPTTNLGGRPSLYQPRYAAIARILCARGATDVDLADAFQVTTNTILNWQSAYPEFGDAIYEGKVEIFDPKVERALAQRALGYSVDTEEVKVTAEGDIIRYPIRKHYPPDTTAAIFWLKNRQPAKWRDVWKIEQNTKISLETVNVEQLIVEIREKAEELGLLELVPVGVAPPATRKLKDGD